jgi:hypothetical protein
MQFLLQWLLLLLLVVEGCRSGSRGTRKTGSMTRPGTMAGYD